MIGASSVDRRWGSGPRWCWRRWWWGCCRSRAHALRRVHWFGHVPELLITFGLRMVPELVQLIWARQALQLDPPCWTGPAFTLVRCNRVTTA